MCSSPTHKHLKTQTHKHNKNMEFLTDLFKFLKERKKFFLVPVILVLLLIGVLLVIGGGSAIAPFIYTLF